MNETLKKELCYLYGSAYQAGHEDTVEGTYEDYVDDCLEDMPKLSQILCQHQCIPDKIKKLPLRWLDQAYYKMHNSIYAKNPSKLKTEAAIMKRLAGDLEKAIQAEEGKSNEGKTMRPGWK